MLGHSNMLIKMHARPRVCGTPEDWHGQGSSDDAPFLVSFGGEVQAEESHSIPKFVCKHPNLKCISTLLLIMLVFLISLIIGNLSCSRTAGSLIKGASRNQRRGGLH